MIVEYEWNAGLVFGLAVDTIYMVESMTANPSMEEPATVIYVHLGLISFSLIMV